MKFLYDESGEILSWGTDADGSEIIPPDDWFVWGQCKYKIVNDQFVVKEDWKEPETIENPVAL